MLAWAFGSKKTGAKKTGIKGIILLYNPWKAVYNTMRLCQEGPW